jgi:hypothetical protein
LYLCFTSYFDKSFHSHQNKVSLNFLLKATFHLYVHLFTKMLINYLLLDCHFHSLISGPRQGLLPFVSYASGSLLQLQLYFMFEH